jgi:deoxyribodipyrimidine photo-lyase
MSPEPGLLWLRLDLRLADNPALAAAVRTCSSVIPVFIWAPEEESLWAPGAASRWWLHQSLLDLEHALAKRGSKLILRRGPTEKALLDLATESDARSIFWNRRYEPTLVARDRNLKTLFRKRGLAVESFPGNVLFEPWTVQNSAGKPFRVFTAFWKACLTEPPPPTAKPVPQRIQAPSKWPVSLAVSNLRLEPEVDWAIGMRQNWRPGESGATSQMKAFLNSALEAYPIDRDRPDLPGTSRLSPHLHFGEISSRQIWRAVHNRFLEKQSGDSSAAAYAYLREIAWREFAHQLLFHFPESSQEPLQTKFSNFPYRTDGLSMKAWTHGKTGYPLVDAGMRQLWHTGWMHNRVRMIVASFLVKHLLIRWQDGASWFWDTLVDADLANNSLGWQWVAGCGADAAPYFRIFNPVLQGEKFDPDGDYVRRWVPELTGLSNAWIHKPWKAPALLLAEAGVQLGDTYPMPIVDHETAHKRALLAFASIR